MTYEGETLYLVVATKYIPNFFVKKKFKPYIF